jgi:hypothetical protein
MPHVALEGPGVVAVLAASRAGRGPRDPYIVPVSEWSPREHSGDSGGSPAHYSDSSTESSYP